MLATIETYFLLFITYAFFGWCIEAIDKSIRARRFVHRGFLIGPYLPIYGVGGLLVTVLLGKYADDPLALFLLATITCGVLEYLTSFILEKIFHTRWWDYSDKPFNINGRVGLRTLVPLGLAGTAMVYISPLIFDFFGLFPEALMHTLSLILLIIFCVDVVVSVSVLVALRKVGKTAASNTSRGSKSATKTTSSAHAAHYDATEEITREIRTFLRTHSWRSRRLLQAFPHLRHTRKSKTSQPS